MSIKTTFFLIVLFFVCPFQNSKAQIEAYFTYCVFHAPETGPFIETYLNFNGRSIAYKQVDSLSMQGNIELQMILKKDDNIVDFQKLVLNSPLYSDTTKEPIDFIDIQRFGKLNSTGKFELEVSIRDNITNDSTYTSNQIIEVNSIPETPFFSDIELIQSWSKASMNDAHQKSGVVMVPYVSNYYPSFVKKLTFYTELYQLQKSLEVGEAFLFNFYIENPVTDKVFRDYRKFKKQEVKNVNSLINEFDISNLPSGNYNLVIEARNKENEMICEKTMMFQRSNTGLRITPEDLSKLDISNTFAYNINSHDTIIEYIKSGWPIAEDQEKNFINGLSGSTDLLMLQRFFYDFWTKRNALDPEAEWNSYKEKIKIVNRNFSTSIKKGYETERGRVYLKYGKPNTVSDRPSEPSSYPYQIWHYYKAGRFSNAKFVFYNPDLATNDYDLLHSTIIGEPNNYRWQYILEKRNTSATNIDDPGGDGFNHYGTRKDDYFTNPR